MTIFSYYCNKEKEAKGSSQATQTITKKNQQKNCTDFASF
jgi:hypothetical protein